jgi:hypothetical protein
MAMIFGIFGTKNADLSILVEDIFIGVILLADILVFGYKLIGYLSPEFLMVIG